MAAIRRLRPPDCLSLKPWRSLHREHKPLRAGLLHRFFLPPSRSRRSITVAGTVRSIPPIHGLLSEPRVIPAFSPRTAAGRPFTWPWSLIDRHWSKRLPLRSRHRNVSQTPLLSKPISPASRQRGLHLTLSSWRAIKMHLQTRDWTSPISEVLCTEEGRSPQPDPAEDHPLMATTLQESWLSEFPVPLPEPPTSSGTPQLKGTRL